jgi:hypothetical protein
MSKHHHLLNISGANLSKEMSGNRSISINESKDKETVSESEGFLEECEHIHNKSIFDSVNEGLNLIRFPPSYIKITHF